MSVPGIAQPFLPPSQPLTRARALTVAPARALTVTRLRALTVTRLRALTITPARALTVTHRDGLDELRVVEGQPWVGQELRKGDFAARRLR
eukprot:3436199-Rhodomonas_salina.2